jgi:hypothetical protein
MTKQSVSWKPRSYQLEAVKLMVRQAALGLFMKPGRGKTSVVLMALRILQDAGFVKKLLVVCPIRPMYTVWPNQPGDYDEFKHLRVKVLHGKKKDEALFEDDADIYVVNPEGLEWLFGATVEKTGRGNKIVLNHDRVQYIKNKFQMLVVDESTKFKNSQTNRFKLLRQVVKHFKRRYILTGSPRPKGMMDLFGQMFILDEGAALGSYITHYRQKFFHPAGFGGYDWQLNEGGYAQILERIKPLSYVVDNEEGLDLPELLPNDIWVNFDAATRSAYKRMEDDMMVGEVVASNAAVASSKCRQICNGGLYASTEEEKGTYKYVHTLKYDALKDLMEQLDDPLLITYEFGFDRDYLVKEMGIPCISTGNAKKDAETIEKFSRGELPAVCGQPQSIALGIDGLQKNCADIAMLGVPWDLLNYEQVIQRVRRSGNKKSAVTLHRILVRDSVDERVIKVLDNRDREQVNFLTALRRDASLT